MPKMTMFTYGILKFPENIRAEGGKVIAENAYIVGHEMYIHAKSFPVTKYTGKESDKVYGTLFEIDENVVKNYYDTVEGYQDGRPSHLNMYNRIEVDVLTPNGEKVKAQMYFANPYVFARTFTKKNHIPSGKYEDFLINRRRRRQY